ncbi:hypothetical protein E4U21_004258 [Claviceps maximensis]|nr:hypothetical protein E4U21_004258 [Claviceps maximensis]
MQFLSLLAASLTFVAAQATTTWAGGSSNDKPNWCTAAGYPGDNSCENAGLHTYCCTYIKGGEFTIWRDVKGMSTDGKGNWLCPNLGTIQCA